MAFDPKVYDEALDRAAQHARSWLAEVSERPVPPREGIDQLLERLGGPLPDQPSDPAEVVDLLATQAEPGLMAMNSGRFYGWVIGGVLPAALGADWLVSAWDQNTGLRYATPATAAAEEVAAGWLLDLLGLPAGCDVGFVTGGTMANVTCLAAARQGLLGRAGWDFDRDGLSGAPRIHVLVGAERHDTIDLALRVLGLGAPVAVAADDQGRIDPDALATALAAAPDGPVLVCLQAGNVHSGAYDPFERCIELAHEHGAWVHIDGAFGLFAGVSPRLAHLLEGFEGADSWATDAHKTLNVPYDCGVAIVRDPAALRSAVGVHASYLIEAEEAGPADPLGKVFEMSRRARGVPVWAALRSLGRIGVGEMVDGLVQHAQALARGIADIPGAEVLNDVPFTQVCVSFGDDERTRAVTAALIEDGTVWMSGSTWHDRAVLRISVSNFSTDADDVSRSVDAVRRAVLATG